MALNDEYPATISKAAREKIIQRLMQAYTHDHLEEDDFEKRLVVANKTQKRSELAALVADLPEQKEEQKAPTVARPGTVAKTDTIFSFFSGITRKGKWKPAQNIKSINIFGGTDLDFTNAVLAPGITEIKVFCFMGGVDIIVPPGINVDANCVAIMGGFDNKAHGIENPNLPTLRIRGFCFMGGVDVKHPKKKLLDRILKKLGLD
jgi:predicted membrane protein